MFTLTDLRLFFNPTVLEGLDWLRQQVGRISQPTGLYEVLNYEATLELHDPQGHKATYSKAEEVRFLQDNVIAYQDQAWGDGDIFAEYHCSPGIPVDRYPEGNLQRVLISLRETKNRGEVERLLMERHILNGFRQSTENFQNKVSHHIHQFTISLIFPQQRHPKRVVLVQENAAKVQELGGEYFHQLPDGRQQATWQTQFPKRFESYTFRWQW